MPPVTAPPLKLGNDVNLAEPGEHEVLILATGGTLDKIHDPIGERLVFPHQSHVPALLRQCFPVFAFQHPQATADEPAHPPGFRVETVMLRDSLELTDNDRLVIAEACRRDPTQRIIITHGTSTMTLTAETLRAEMVGAEKVIVLCGAMRPFSLGHSDALFHFGMALGATQCLPPGVYLAIGGRIWAAGTVEKDHSSGQFSAKKVVNPVTVD